MFLEAVYTDEIRLLRLYLYYCAEILGSCEDKTPVSVPFSTDWFNILALISF